MQRGLSLRPLLLIGLLAIAGLLALQPRVVNADEPYFVDDFSSTAERYFFEGDLDKRVFRYVDDEYEIDTTQGSTYGQSVLLEDLDSYTAEVTARMVHTDDPNGGLGLSFNYRERDGGGSDFLLLLAYDRGAYTVLRYLNGRTDTLIKPVRTKLFKSGDTIGMRVQNRNGEAVCFINGIEVARFKEDTLSSGGFGVFASQSSVARFDDFRIYTSGAGAAGGQGFTDDMRGGTLYNGDYGGVEYSFRDGEYIIDTSKTSKAGLSPYSKNVQDFELSCDVRLMKGDPVNGYGIFIRDYSGDGGFNQFRLLVSGGWYAVEQSKDDRSLAVSQWQEDSVVRPGGTNNLKVRAEGGDLIFYVNGAEVYRMSDDNPHAGAFGLYACGGIEAAFDNVEYTELQP